MTIFAFLVIFSLFLKQVDVISYNLHSWQTGLWSSCLSLSGCGNGQRERVVECTSNKHGTIVEDSNCDASTKPVSLESCSANCYASSQQLHWLVSSWSSCTRQDLQACDIQLVGRASRSVSCVSQHDNGSINSVADSECEVFSSRPADHVLCSLQCPQYCTFDKNFSQQHRSQFQIYSDADVLENNDNFLFSNDNSQFDCYSNRSEAKFTLKVDNWSKCQSAEHGMPPDMPAVIPVVGLKFREISCVGEDGGSVSMSHCNSHSKLITTERCLVPTDCELSPWSRWRVVKSGCVNSLGEGFAEERVRSRHIVAPSVGDGLSCGPLHEKQVTMDNSQQCSLSYEWQSSEWSPCNLLNNSNTAENANVVVLACGGGLKSRNVICMRLTDSVPIEDSLCREPRPKIVQTCQVPCPQDCKVSQWSEWSPCTPAEEVHNYIQKVFSGYVKRSREIVSPSLHGGSDCPHLEEADNCDEVYIAQWMYGDWSSCRIRDSSSTCGMGNKSREATCYSYKGELLNDLFCQHHDDDKEVIEECQVPCPNDCVLSEWSEWSPCPKQCFTKSKSIYQQDRTVIAVRGKNGAKCGDTVIKEWCGMDSCDWAKWLTEPWQNCEILSNSSSCGQGQQRREVKCVVGNVPQYVGHCRAVRMPAEIRECFKSCPRDCVVTAFSDWSPCPSSYTPGAMQKRHRYVTSVPKHGGNTCPHLDEEMSCSYARAYHQWLIGSWSSCLLIDVEASCGIGFRVRNLTCISKNGYPVEMHHCLDSSWNHQSNTAVLNIPVTVENCRIECYNSTPVCVLSEWSVWSECRYRLGETRNRSRSVIAVVKHNFSCEAYFELTKVENCPNPEPGFSKITHSSRILDPLNKTEDINNGTMHEYSGPNPVDLESHDLSSTRGNCTVHYPVDCKMSEWSDWSDCRVVGYGLGYSYRERLVLQRSNHLGRPCLSLVLNQTHESQVKVCGIPYSQFRWLAGGWTNCKLTKIPHRFNKCGKGTQRRSAYCINENRYEVDFGFCDPYSKPVTKSSCEVACPGGCVLSNWVTWERCTQPCSHQNYEVKKRTIIRSPHSSKKCDKLTERVPCRKNSNCFHYSLHVGQWSSCLLPKDAVCGEGTQQRILFCSRNDGRPVDLALCQEVLPSDLFHVSLSQPCFLECPIDCRLSDWSKWNDQVCNSHCNNKMNRSRVILQQPNSSGRPCLPNLVEEKPCPLSRCYHWHVSEWSECNLPRDSCGFGTKFRQVRCVAPDNLEVDPMICIALNLSLNYWGWSDSKWLLAALDKLDEKECYVPCPRECVLSTWSTVNDCHGCSYRPLECSIDSLGKIAFCFKLFFVLVTLLCRFLW